MIPEVENTEKSLEVWQQMLKMEANISIQATSANKLAMVIILELEPHILLGQALLFS
jgi:hypothetical protein